VISQCIQGFVRVHGGDTCKREASVAMAAVVVA